MSNITPFGGLHLIDKQFVLNKLPEFINNELGSRSPRAIYSYSDMLLTMTNIVLCGGDCAEDVNYHRATFSSLLSAKAPSADRLLAMQLELSTQAEYLLSQSGVVNKINVNDKLNDFMQKMALKLGVLNQTKQDYCLDFDHQFIANEKYDSTYSYKKQRGYFPAVASIANTPVYFENRNGNSSVKFKQLDTITRAHGLLKNNEIKLSRCRMDCGSYIKEVTDYLEKESVKFYIRAEQSETLLFEASVNENWKSCEIGFNQYQVCSFEYEFGSFSHRIVAYRWPNKTRQVDLITNDANSYLFIITNDREWDEQTIVSFYNQRGNSERLFDIQNNDFNWKKIPFSYLEQNTVYFIIMAVCNIIYQWIIGIFSKSLDCIKVGQRLKKFTYRIVCMVGKVIKTGRKRVVKLFTAYDLSKLKLNTS